VNDDQNEDDIGRYQCRMVKLEIIYKSLAFKAFVPPNAPPNSLKDSNANPKMKIMEGVEGCSLTHNILGG
jgi:hypothetical protein